MRNLMIMCALVTVTVGCAIVDGGADEKANERKLGRKMGYYTNIDIKRTPIRVFGKIDDDQLSLFNGACYKAFFDKSGRVIALEQHNPIGVVKWSSSYEYYPGSNTVSKETWEQNGSVTVKVYSRNGRLIRKDGE